MTGELLTFLVVMAIMMGLLFAALRRADKHVNDLLADMDELKKRPP
jgi:hypothetical protein